MSCVVGLLNNGSIYMGADGVATTDEGEKRPIIADKIFKNKNYLMGFTGSVRTGQLAAPKFLNPPSNIYDLPDALRELLIEKGSLLINDSQQHLQSCNFLVGYQGRLFEILSDFQLNEIRGNFTAIGSGGTYAMGSLFSTKKWKSPINRITSALEAASYFDGSCGKPFMFDVIE